MGNPDIKDYINSLDDNQKNNDRRVDEKEVQLLNTVLEKSNSNPELVDVLNDTSELRKLTTFVINGIENQKDSTSL
jgi:hypothetical protein